MPSYAVLGATGSTGSSLIQVLLQSPDNQVHAYCRSKQKLIKTLPDLAINENSQIQVFEGQLQDVQLLSNCISGTRAVFLAVAVTDNIPGCSVARDTADVVVSALERLQQEDRTASLPKLVVLSSASLEHATLMAHEPAYTRGMARRAFSNIYSDLEMAEEFLRSKAIVPMFFIKPGALTKDKQRGHILSTESAISPVSFMDLAAGMIEVAQDESEGYDWKNVAVNATSKDIAFPWDAPSNIFWGLLFHYLPWLYQYLG